MKVAAVQILLYESTTVASPSSSPLCGDRTRPSPVLPPGTMDTDGSAKLPHRFYISPVIYY